MAAIVTTCDPYCVSLAKHFLREEPLTPEKHVAIHRLRVTGLSLAIQQAVEDWLEEHPYPPKRCDHKFIDSVACLKCGWRPPESGATTSAMLPTGERENPLRGAERADATAPRFEDR